MPEPLADPGARHFLATDARWWPGVARLLLPSAGPVSGADAWQADLRDTTVLVPRIGHAPLLRAALRDELGGQACVGPRILTLEAWTGTDALPAVARHVELFEALRANAWVRERFGAHAGPLWSLARDIAALGDELTLAACGAPEAFAGRWAAAVQRCFSQRAAAAGDPQAQLVLALWRAGMAQDLGAAQLRERLEALARGARGPLLWLLPEGAAPWQLAYCATYRAASGQAASVVEADVPALAAGRPWLAAAWPELAAPQEPPAPLAQRAAALRAQRTDAPSPALRIWRCQGLEEEAMAAAQWAVEQLRNGRSAVALVALDRLAARRVRALLERAGVALADEAGWKMSTTSAAAALMRWLDLVIADFAHAELLDWLRSPFTANGDAQKGQQASFIARALVDQQVHGGAGAVRAAVARAAQRAHETPAAGSGPEIAAGALALVDSLLAQARPWQASASLGRYFALLDAALDALGMRAPLAADAVGATVLEAVERMREALAGARLVLDLPGFRAFLAEQLESLRTAGPVADGRVVMTTLAGTRLRSFDAALLIGVDADHLPGRAGAAGLLAPAVRRELGLVTEAGRQREQLQDLASLLAGTPQVAATWRQRDGDAPRALSPWLDRLDLLVGMAGAPALLADPVLPWLTVSGGLRPAPAPAWAGRLPARLSASGYQDLIDCPYRFFALRMLGLRETPRLQPRPDKRDLGTVLHRVLYEFHRGLADGSIETPDTAALRGTIDGVLRPLLRQRPALIAYGQRLRQMAPGYIAWCQQDRALGWRWMDGERTLSRPLPLPGAAPDGAVGSVELFGRIDRLDAGPQDAQRILDFKTRDGASLRREQKDPGEAAQLLFYGLLPPAPPAQAAYLSLQAPADPRQPTAGVATLVEASAPFAGNVALLGERIVRDLVRIARGAPLAASGAESVCRRCELRSLCRHGHTAAAQAPAEIPPGSEGAGPEAAA